MRFHADLHIHSKYSRACSKDCDLEHLAWWARRKGIALVGTGDFTHPAWFEHLQENLTPAEPGVFRLRDDLDRAVTRTLPPALAAAPVRFMLSVEISTIYKRADRTRKVHHLVYVPDLDAAAEFNRRLGRIGNLASDGRPILGLDSRDLLEITLESSPDAYLVPAHVWTPWFAVLGSKAGFDAVADCYADLADHIFALETGLSSDPPMNWRVSALDRYRLVSNSDAHSPPILGREATVFDTDLDYFGVRRALETGVGLAGTVEFFPEEGKYHVDGHRKCGVRLDPPETRQHGGLCPECGKPLTVGVLSRVEELADRPEGFLPDGAPAVRNLVPLPEVMSEIYGVGPKSKKVLGEIATLTAALGPELSILEDVPVADIQARSPLLAEAVARLRTGDVIRDAGYDGEYGVIRLFQPGELGRLRAPAAAALFDEPPTVSATARVPASAPPRPTQTDVSAAQPALVGPAADGVDGVVGVGGLDGLDAEQRAAVQADDGPLLIVAGPGTGKTRVLTHRIARLVTTGTAAPEHCLAITFTRRAAEELADRLRALTPQHAADVTVATFHALGLRILRDQHERAGLSPRFGVADHAQRLATAAAATGDERQAGRLLAELSRLSRRRDELAPELGAAADRYAKALRQRDLVDFDDLLTLPVELLESDERLADHYRDRHRWISVDEYQDIDEWQYRLLRQFAPADGNLAAIGDPDQSIYRFRGGDVGFFLRFQQDFPHARTVRLTRNYRSSAPILEAASQVIAPATLVPDRRLHAVTGRGDGLVGVHHAADEQAEASFVARSIEQLLGGTSFHSLDSGRVRSDGAHGLDLSDFAVLYRTDRQARAVMEALTQAGLPFQKRSHDRLADRPGVDRVLTELTYVADSARATDPGLVAELGPVTERLRAAGQAVLARPGLTPDDAATIHAAVELLLPLAERCGGDLDRFRAELALGVEVDTWDPRADRISLLTLHAAKGLEFPVVFIVGCEDGLLPLRWPGDEPGRIDDEDVREERRLLFVGMTRARRRLYLSHAAERFRHGGHRTAKPSPFLADLDVGAYERVGVAQPRKKRRDTQLRLM